MKEHEVESSEATGDKRKKFVDTSCSGTTELAMCPPFQLLSSQVLGGCPNFSYFLGGSSKQEVVIRRASFMAGEGRDDMRDGDVSHFVLP